MGSGSKEAQGQDPGSVLLLGLGEKPASGNRMGSKALQGHLVDKPNPVLRGNLTILGFLPGHPAQAGLVSCAPA